MYDVVYGGVRLIGVAFSVTIWSEITPVGVKVPAEQTVDELIVKVEIVSAIFLVACKDSSD